jgi:uncharacterized lipoprotein YddW (UPF0748 family)
MIDYRLRMAVACALLLQAPSIAFSAFRETRGVWVTADWLTSSERIQEVVSVARQLRANALFVQVRRRGDAYYGSTLVPGASGQEGAALDYDPFSLILARAREAGLEVHAWLNMYFVWSDEGPPIVPGHALSDHPEWVLRDGKGVPLTAIQPDELNDAGYDGLFLDPGNPEVRHHLRRVVRELLVRYDLDGVHLDYIRYPTAHCGYTVECRRTLRSVTGRDFVSAAQLGGADAEAALWRTWRAGQVSTLVRGISRDVAAIRPDACVTAAVVPDPSLSYQLYGQDWIGWLNEGLIDAAVAMTFSDDAELVRAQLEAGRALTGPGGLYAGLGLFNRTCQELIARIHVARDVGCDGVVLYSFRDLSDDPAYRYGLSLGPFREAAVPDRCRAKTFPEIRPPRSLWPLPRTITGGAGARGGAR